MTEASRDAGSRAPAATVIGAGGGTLLLGIASSLPDESFYKSLLMWAAPTVSVLASSAWLWARAWFLNYLRDLEARAVFNDAKRTVDSELKSGSVSAATRRMLERYLEAATRALIERKMERIRALSVVPSSDATWLASDLAEQPNPATGQNPGLPREDNRE